MGVHLEDYAGDELSDRFTAPDVIEVDAGVYAIRDLIAPSTPGLYLIIWDTGADPLTEDDVAVEDLKVEAPVAFPEAGNGALTQNELDLMRSAYANFLPDTVQVLRRVETKVGGGSTRHDWVEHLVDQPARITLGGGGEDASSSDSNREADEETQTIYFAGGTDVVEEDRIQTAFTTYEVNSVVKGGLWELSRPVRVTEVA
jgi:hypothetical protein